MQQDDEAYDNYPLSYSIDNSILMHRDVHFGGNFSIMVDYYKKGGKGVVKDFDIDRLTALDQMEQAAGKNLSTLLLSGAEIEKISRARQVYKNLRALYEVK